MSSHRNFRTSHSPRLYPSLETEENEEEVAPFLTEDEEHIEENFRNDASERAESDDDLNSNRTPKTETPSSTSSGGSRNPSLFRRGIRDLSAESPRFDTGSSLPRKRRSHVSPVRASKETPRITAARSSRANQANYAEENNFWNSIVKFLSENGKAILLFLAGVMVFLGTGFFNDFNSIFRPGPALYFVKFPDAFEIFKKDLTSMKSQFSSQEKRSWTTIRAATRPVLNVSEPLQPAVILLVSANAEVLNCFSRGLAEVAAKAYGSSYKNLKGAAYANLSGSKLKLDQDLKSVFDGEKSPVLLLSGIDELSSEAALVLHAYCDNDNAPFKDTVIIFTMLVSEEVSLDTENCDSTAQNFLKRALSSGNNGLNADKIGALLSRVANNVVCVQKEEQLSC